MRHNKWILSFGLAAAMFLTSLPGTLYAADVAAVMPDDAVMPEGYGTMPDEQNPEVYGAMPNGQQEGYGLMSKGQQPEDEVVVEEASKADLLLDATVLTPGGEAVTGNTGRSEYYIFTPEETGLYYMTYLPEGETRARFHYLCNASWYYGTDRLNTYSFMYLNQGSAYEFDIAGYNMADAADYTLQMSGPVEIADITVAKEPLWPSYHAVDFTGLQLQYELTDGTKLVDDIDASMSGPDYSNAYLEIFRFLDMWRHPITGQVDYGGWTVSPYLYTYYNSTGNVLLDGGYASVSQLEDGAHTAEYDLQITQYDSTGIADKVWSKQISIPFMLERDAVASIEVIETEKTTYQEKMNENLEPVTIKVNYKDGREPRIISSEDNGEVIQQLVVSAKSGQAEIMDETDASGRGDESAAGEPAMGLSEDSGSEPEPEKTGEPESEGPGSSSIPDTSASETPPTQTPSTQMPASEQRNAIDAYLANGGSTGTVNVTVTYRGATASYPITIEESVYESFEVIPVRDVYYAGCTVKDSNGSTIKWGDNCGSISKFVFHRKDGSDEEYLNWGDLPGYGKNNNYPQTGFVISDNTAYMSSYVDDYLANGGSLGDAKVRVKYAGFETFYDARIEKKEVDHIEVIQEPSQTTYLHNSNAYLNHSGMVIRAYQDAEGTVWEDYDYSECTSATMYYFQAAFGAVLDGSNNIAALEVGTYPVHIYFNGKETSYNIEVADSLVSEISVIKKPERPYLFVGEDANNASYLIGLELEVKEYDGTAKKYRYEQYNSDEEYSSWDEITNEWQYYRLDTSSIDSSKEGIYDVLLFYKGITVEIPIEVRPSPVEEIIISKMPDKTSYYAYLTEDWDIDLTGMEFEIRYNDGTDSYRGTISYDTSSVSVPYDGTFYSFTSYGYKNTEWDENDDIAYAAVGENALLMRYLGKTVEIPITVTENPVKSIVCTKNPDRTEYFQLNGIYETIDLTGAEFLVTYSDDTTEKVVCTDRKMPVLDKYKDIQLRARRDTIWNEGVWENIIRIYCASATVTIPIQKCDAREHVDAILEEEDLRVINMPGNRQVYVLSYTPDTTQDYYFSVAADDWTELYLYDSELELLADTESDNGTVRYELNEGETYYYVISKSAGSNLDILVRLSASMTRAGLTDDDVEGIRVTKAPLEAMHYDFEGVIWAHSYHLDGMELEITLKSGKTLTKEVSGTCYGTSTVFGLPLSVNWKEIEYTDEGETYAVKSDSNALTFTYAGKTAEVPAVLNAKSPVSSIEVTKNPWAGKKYYQYNASEAMYDDNGLELTIHYNDGRADDVLTCENGTEDYYLNGYYVSRNCWLKYDDDDNVKTGEQYVSYAYMGASTEAAFMVQEDPVRSVSITKEPDKMTYVPIGSSAVDLYGMETSIFFTDGTRQTVKVTEHTDKVLVKEDIYLSGRISGGSEGRKLYIECAGKTVSRPMAALPLSECTDGALTEDEEISVSLDALTIARIYSFTAKESGVYAFYSQGNYDTYGSLYDASGSLIASDDDSGSDEGNFRVEAELYAGKTYYFVPRMYSEGREGTFTCTLEKVSSAVEKEKVEQLEITVPIPQAGRYLADEDSLYEENNTAKYSINSVRWSPADSRAGYGKVYRMTMKLAPKKKYEFSTDIKIKINGSAVSGVGLTSDGGLTVSYAFPRTQCKVSFPEEVAGYVLDTSMNDNEDGLTEYKGSYRFAYNKAEGADGTESIIVKANGNVLTPDEDGIYTVSAITSLVNIIVKTSDITAGPDESLIKMYDKLNLYDIMKAELGASVSDNTEENILPVMESYQNGSDQFFFGWYTAKNAQNNGTGTRFTSKTLTEKTAYDLFAKWGTGVFSHPHNGLYANYRILAIDENNRIKLQFGDGHSPAVAAKELSGGLKADSADNAIEIPGMLDLSENDALGELGIELGDADVVSIGANAFAGNTDMTSIKIPDTVENIGEDAFKGCTNLEKVVLPASLGSIESGTFRGCSSLSNVVIPEGVTAIGAGAFDGCTSLAAVTLPESIEAIEADAFKGVSGMTVVCSGAAAEKEAVSKFIQETNATVETIEVLFDGYSYVDKAFKLSDKGIRMKPVVKVNGEISDRKAVLSWTEGYEDYFTVTEENGSYVVAPKAPTEETYVLTAEISGIQRQLAFTVDYNRLDADLYEGEKRYAVDDIPPVVYSEQDICPEVVVRDKANGNILQKDTDYELEYGSGQVWIYGIGNYRGTLTKGYMIQKALRTITASDMTTFVGRTDDRVAASISGDAELMYYSSNPSVVEVDTKTGVLIPKQAGTAVITIVSEETNHYEAAMKNITVTVKPAAGTSGGNGGTGGNNGTGGNGQTGGNNGTGGITVTETKKEKSITVSSLSVTKAVGSKKFSLGAKVTGNEPMTFSSSKAKVAAVDKNGNVTVKSIGQTVITIQSAETASYKAAKAVKVTLTVTPAKTVLSSVKSSKTGKITVKWKKTKQAGGYKIMYSTSKNFKNAKTVEVKSGKTTSKTINVKKGKKYYIKVCAYKKVSGIKQPICGEYSKPKNVKAKK